MISFSRYIFFLATNNCADSGSNESVDNAEVADLLQDGAFDVCTKILSVALMH